VTCHNFYCVSFYQHHKEDLIMDEKQPKIEEVPEKLPYSAPCIIQKREIVIDLQTNILSDEPPPPL